MVDLRKSKGENNLVMFVRLLKGMKKTEYTVLSSEILRPNLHLALTSFFHPDSS